VLVRRFTLAGWDRMHIQIEQRGHPLREVHLGHTGLLGDLAARSCERVPIRWIEVTAGLEPAPESPVKDQDQ